MHAYHFAAARIDALEPRALLSGDLAVDYALGVFNATPSSGLPQMAHTAAAMQADGKLLIAAAQVVGYSDAVNYFGNDLTLLRYTSDDKLDPAFGQGGFTRFHFPDGNFASARKIVIQPDGRIVVAGGDLGFTRFNPNGTIDNTFGDPGHFKDKTDDPVVGVADMISQAEGRLVIAFTTKFGHTRIFRFTQDGAIDGQFNRAHADTPGENSSHTQLIALSPMESFSSSSVI